MKHIPSIALICISLQAFAQRITLSGFVKEATSQEQLPGANVYIEGTSFGTATNSYGFYSLTVPLTDSAVLVFSCIGYRRHEHKISLRENKQINVWLSPDNQLDEVVIKTQRDDPVSDVQMSQIDVSVQQIKKIPAFFGEKDVLKVLQLMPGVQKGTEGQTGLYVRGGGPDQNLIILDDALVYNANHLFGFFSVFNSDAIKSVELTKGGFPARYGGRLSSVVDMNMKEGSKDRLHGEGGIGLLSSRLTLEGPIRKEKSSFLVSARRTYLDVLAAPIIASAQKGQDERSKPGYYFYDLNAKVNFDISKKDKLYLSSYFGRDKFYMRDKSRFYRSNANLYWGNATATLRWNHLFTQKLFANSSLIFSNFHFGVVNEFTDLDDKGAEIGFSSSRYQSSIRDVSLKTDFDYYLHPQHNVRFGIQAVFHKSTPSALEITGADINPEVNKPAQNFNSTESGAYLEDTWQLSDAFKLNMGIRLSTFLTQGKTYVRPEPRASAALRLAKNLTMKLSYAMMNQYVHLLSNTGVGLPTDLWVPATKKIVPQHSEQFAGGFAGYLERPALTVTLEGYYKKMDHILSYKEGASFVNIDGEDFNEVSWQDNVTAGRGWSYGAELLVQKKSGKLSGWAGYTLSWTRWNFPQINFGRTFFPRHDRRHDISIVGIYEVNKRITLSGTWVYGTGNALTLPVSTYNALTERFSGASISNDAHLLSTSMTEYSGRGNFRAEPFHRMDLAIQFHKRKKRYDRTWEFAIYNVYSRKNPFFYDIDTDQANHRELKKYSLFPILPSLSYNFKF